ncbi:MAG TPA: Crp/Fnr family transcriptional regulator [Stellaceae bacterium]|jgi:CRP-like cAMP-binding protein|nr:Crp/Fnr family transcriptional regulator [Stellaceae bacterium]
MPQLANASKNRLLATLPSEDIQRLSPHCQQISLRQRDILYRTGEQIKHVYFIEQGIVSILTNMLDGSTIEVGMIGTEGLVGMSAMLGAETSAQQAIVQIGGTALRMSTAPCRDAFDQSAAVRRVFHRFTDSLINLSAQTAACNRLHSIEQRCARWLLMACDRNGSLTMPMTQEFLSSMLGVRRAGVTETAGELQRSGLIRYHRGQLTVIDRNGLEASACECYGIDHRRLENLLE